MCVQFLVFASVLCVLIPLLLFDAFGEMFFLYMFCVGLLRCCCLFFVCTSLDVLCVSCLFAVACSCVCLVVYVLRVCVVSAVVRLFCFICFVSLVAIVVLIAVCVDIVEPMLLSLLFLACLHRCLVIVVYLFVCG